MQARRRYYRYMKVAIIRNAIVAAVVIGLSATSGAVTVSFQGGSRKVLEETPDKSTGLDKIYVAYSAGDLTSMELAGASGALSVQRYSNLGGGYSEPVQVRWVGSTAVIDRPAGNMGYIITDQDRSQYIWLVDYSTQKFSISSASAYSPQECDNTRISVVGNGPAIQYFTIDGRPVELSRDIEIAYTTEVWNEAGLSFDRAATVKTIPHLTDPIVITPAFLCATDVAVRGDRFLKAWGMEAEAVTPTIEPNGLEIHATVEQTNLPEDVDEVGSNIIGGEDGGQESSAPADMKLTAYITDAVIHSEWQITEDSNFDNIDYRFNEPEVDYTFDEEGTYYMRFVGSDATGSCSVYSDVFTVSIGASDLRIPNAFTPNDDGVNDVWKVAYRSLLEFKCWIFDRYGNEIYHFEDPNDGWDGKYRGKPVKSGVYFYVIEAKGSDGKKYKKGGDINIVGFKTNTIPGGSVE